MVDVLLHFEETNCCGNTGPGTRRELANWIKLCITRGVDSQREREGERERGSSELIHDINQF
jgi:hypothetical protein